MQAPCCPRPPLKPSHAATGSPAGYALLVCSIYRLVGTRRCVVRCWKVPCVGMLRSEWSKVLAVSANRSVEGKSTSFTDGVAQIHQVRNRYKLGPFWKFATYPSISKIIKRFFRRLPRGSCLFAEVKDCEGEIYKSENHRFEGNGRAKARNLGA